jgi:hypothetical protein
MRVIVAMALAAGAFAAGPAHAQATRPAPAPAAPAVAAPQPAPVLSESAKAVLGSWEYSNSDRDKICSVILKADPTAVGFKVEFDDRCAGAFSLVPDIVGWRMTDNELLRFLDASGKPLVEFSEVESGIYEAPTPGFGVLFLQTAASAEPPPVTAEQMAGDWSIQRAGKPICTLSLLNRASGDADFALQIQPRCEAAVTQFNPQTWRMDRGELVLSAASGDTWRFAQTDGAWHRIPEHASSLTIVRK